MSGLDEPALIARYFRPLASDPAALGLGDDAALLTPPPGQDLVITTDAIAEGFHFLADEPGDVVARKALRVNLSDLAAKGAEPLAYLVTLGLKRDWTEAWLDGFAAGLAEDQGAYGVALLGGDTIRSAGLTVAITAFGTVPAGGMVRRAGARPGDRLYVSGTIGDAALGLLAIRGGTVLDRLPGAKRDFLAARYRRPEPRNALAPALRAHARAAIDVSDGLAGDLDTLCAASGVTARVVCDQVPLSPAARAGVAMDSLLLDACFTGGDDYEVLCAVALEEATAFEAAARQARVPVSEIGEVVAGEGPSVFADEAGRTRCFGRRSFSHTG